MNRLPGGRRLRLAALALLVLAVVAFGVRERYMASYLIETRSFIIAMKRDGHAPDISWWSVVRRLGPRWTQQRDPLFVKAAGTGEAPCPVRWQTALGSFWGGERDGGVLDHLVIEQLGGRIYDRAPAAIDPGDVVIDVGAHLGTFTRYALQRGAARVIAVEPMPALAACLRRTFWAEIQAGTVLVAEAAAWDSDSSLEFRIGPQSTTGRARAATDRPSDAIIRVRAVRLDSLMRELGQDRVDFIKMDIEGAEPRALAGAGQTIAAFTPRMAICVYHGRDDETLVPAAVASSHAGYAVFFRGPFQAYFH